ncbi:MAG: copper chaperone [Chitinophagales bacterium]
MKNILMAFALLFACSSSFAKDVLTKASFKVSGNCEMCKERIEKAAFVNGVKKAEWNEVSNIMSVVFAPSKISLDSIKQRIADAGYDTDSIKTTDAAYSKLPQCCQYKK